jgi:hypothetical protein
MDIPLNMYRKRKQAAAALFLLQATDNLLPAVGKAAAAVS